MVKIELSKAIEDEHLRYFKDKVNLKLENLKEIESENLPEWHNKFLDHCICRSEKLAKGKPNELKSEIMEINLKFPHFQEQLEVSIKYKKEKVKKNENEDKTSSYSELLQTAFSYASFTAEKTLFDYLLLKAKAIYKENTGEEIKKYNSKLNTSLEKALHLYFPEYTDMIKLPTNSNVEQVKERVQNLQLVACVKSELFISESPWSAYKLALLNKVTVCPYCNRQYIAPIFSDNGKVRGEFDHFFPKSKYPYLSMSLYNLIPSCSACNSSLKGIKEFDKDDIHPYEDSYNDFFDFSINPIDMAHPKVEIIVQKEKEKTEKYLKMFQIEALYNYHSNQWIEMFEKSIIYPDSYLDELLNFGKEQKKENNDGRGSKEADLGKMFDSEEELKALIYGYILDEKDIGKETFGKLRRDVAKQLGLIP